MKILTGFLFKNWSIALPIVALIAFFGTIKLKNNKIERLETAVTAAELATKKANQEVKRVGVVLDSARTDIRRLSEVNRSDSVFFAKQIAGMQSVIAQVRAKAKREKELDDALIEELRKGLPPKECYNVFRKVVPCKD